MRKCLVVGSPKASARPAPKSYLQAVTVAMASGQLGLSGIGSRNIGNYDALHASVGEGCVGGVDRRCSNASSEVFDDDGFKAQPSSSKGTEADAVIVSNTGEEQTRQAALAQVTGETCWRNAVVLGEGRVAVDVLAKAFAQQQLSMRNGECRMEFSAGRSLNAVVRPESLRAVRSFDGVRKRLLAVSAGERDVTAWVPVLGKDDVVELLRKGVDAGNDGIAITDFEGSADAIDCREKVALHVDDEESVVRLRLHSSSLVEKYCCAVAEMA